MSKLKQAKQQIDELLGTKGQPYPIFNQGRIENGGYSWQIQFQTPSPEEIEAINVLQVKVTKSVLADKGLDGQKFFQQVQERFIAESSHLSEKARQFGLEALRFKGDYNVLSHINENKQTFTKVKATANGFGLTVYKTELYCHDNETTEYHQIILGEFSEQFDILRTEQIQGNNWIISTEGIIKILRAIEERFGLSINRADESVVEFEIQRQPKAEEALWLNKELFQLSSQQWELSEDYDIKTPIVIGWD
jgi:Domain of unknown function (DUF4253)